jgi:ssDNA-binding Zn-finger/Zn-ribbon topoisomerase 1
MSEEEKKYKEVECPFCGTKIDHLVLSQIEDNFYDFYGNGEYVESDICGDVDYESREWECPKCHETIATTEKEADEFLKTGGKFGVWK